MALKHQFYENGKVRLHSIEAKLIIWETSQWRRQSIKGFLQKWNVKRGEMTNIAKRENSKKREFSFFLRHGDVNAEKTLLTNLQKKIVISKLLLMSISGTIALDAWINKKSQFEKLILNQKCKLFTHFELKTVWNLSWKFWIINKVLEASAFGNLPNYTTFQFRD